ncbi:MAG TPA: TOBE domain-containing protein [Terriglobia bacterium]|jgi:molybdopterin-binding protein|nr:TOBE domain-containing protein [Terriglobia bacterium]
MSSSELIGVREAAGRLGVSYPTLKQWIYRGKVRTVKTVGGHHRIAQTEIDRLLFQGRRQPMAQRTRRQAPEAQPKPGTGLQEIISGRNQLVGRIVGLKTVGLLTKVTLDVGGQIITSVITSDACRDLKLKVGETAAALIKATEVMIIRPAAGR